MNDDMKIVIPEELTESMQVITTIISPSKEDMGILIMGENMDPGIHKEGPSVIRIYLLGKVEEEYHVETELEAFAFDDIDFATEFLNHLPGMSALELLIMMNSQQLARQPEQLLQ